MRKGLANPGRLSSPFSGDSIVPREGSSYGRNHLAQSVKFIQRRGGGQAAEVLPMDFPLADDFGLGAFSSSSVRPSVRSSSDFAEHFFFYLEALAGSVPA
jgi:hypothetical protein